MVTLHYIWKLEGYNHVQQTPYSKMAENTLFFCLHVNWPLLPRFKTKYSFEFCRWGRGKKGQLTMRQKSNVFSSILEQGV